MSLLIHARNVIVLFVLSFSQILGADFIYRFEGRSYPMGPPRLPNIQTTKLGPTAPPEVKGENGELGIIDLEDLKQDIIEEVMEKLQFDAKIAAINSTLMKMQEKIDGKDEIVKHEEKGDVKCQDVKGKLYVNKCYWLILHSTWDVNFVMAKKLCAKSGGKPGDVLSKFHFNMIDEMAQAQFPLPFSFVDIWTGRTINPKTKVMTMHGGGKRAFIKWRSDWPSSTEIDTRILFTLYRGSRNKYMWNYDPKYNANGVLCQR